MSWTASTASRFPSFQESLQGDGKPSFSRRTDDPVLVGEGTYQVELLRIEAEKEQAFRLRHQLFAETLHWVPEHPSGLEIDEYDEYTEMIALLDPMRRVLGHVRLHESTVPYMIEREFAMVLGSGLLPFKGRDTAELTRFGVHPEARSLVLRTDHGTFDAITLMMKGLYRWSKLRGVRTLFAVTDDRVLRILRMRGLPFESMAEPKLMPDGVTALAVRMNWAHFEEETRKKKPGFLAWFNLDPSAPPHPTLPFREIPAGLASRPWPQPGAGSQHQVSS